MSDTEVVSPNPVQAPAHVHALLERLHAQSLQQESELRVGTYSRVTEAEFDEVMRDKFIALEQDKCWFMYSLIRATGALHIVEAGTSFGVSTIYLALAVLSNGGSDRTGRVIATENEPTKANIARQHWKEAGGDIGEVIELREGDLRETLKADLPDIDLLLLDIWAPLALPTLQIVEPKLRKGAVVLVDNTISSAARYKELLEYLRAPDSGYTSVTLPYHNGLEMCVYHGKP